MSVHPELGAIVTSALRKFLNDAGQYSDNRKRSVRLQMKNEDATDEMIRDVLADEAKVRTYVRDKRKEMLIKIEDIKRRIDLKSAVEMVTAKEMAMWEKHKVWFDADENSETSYLPNDAAVTYSLMIFEIMQMLVAESQGINQSVDDAYHEFCLICINAINAQSSSVAWKSLASTPTHMVGVIDVGSVVRDYVTDDYRVDMLHTKLVSPFARRVLLLERICAISIKCRTPFSILNLSPEETVPEMIRLDKLEKKAQAAVKQCRWVSKGIDDYSAAEYMAWMMITGRNTILEPVFGRNDLSVPMFASSLVGLGAAPFDHVEPRPWAVTDYSPLHNTFPGGGAVTSSVTAFSPSTSSSSSSAMGPTAGFDPWHSALSAVPAGPSAQQSGSGSQGKASKTQKVKKSSKDTAVPVPRIEIELLGSGGLAGVPETKDPEPLSELAELLDPDLPSNAALRGLNPDALSIAFHNVTGRFLRQDYESAHTGSADEKLETTPTTPEINIGITNNEGDGEDQEEETPDDEGGSEHD